MKASEQSAIDVLEKAFSADNLWEYALDIQDYFADETDQLEIDSPVMDDYLQDVIPEFTNSYDNTKRKQWLSELRTIIDHAKTLVKD